MNSTEATAQSPDISHRKKVKAEDVHNEIVDSNLNPEEHLLAKEEAKAELKEQIGDGAESPEDRWQRASEK